MRDATPRTLSTSTLSGDVVYNMQGEKLGLIEDIVLDVETGHVAYAVLSHGGILGIGTDYFAVPWNALTVDTERRAFRLDVDRDLLEDAPGFDKDDWPSSANYDFTDMVYKHYGYGTFATTQDAIRSIGKRRAPEAVSAIV